MSFSCDMVCSVHDQISAVGKEIPSKVDEYISLFANDVAGQ